MIDIYWHMQVGYRYGVPQMSGLFVFVDELLCISLTLLDLVAVPIENET